MITDGGLSYSKQHETSYHHTDLSINSYKAQCGMSAPYARYCLDGIRTRAMPVRDVSGEHQNSEKMSCGQNVIGHELVSD